MGIREMLRNRPGAASLVAGLVVALSAIFAYFQWNPSDAALAPPRKSFVSFDDGKTFDVASADMLAPFTSNGKTASQAYVFSCDGGKTRFVGYLERYSDRAKTLLLEMRKEQASAHARPSLTPDLLNGIEVKRPGDANWVKQSDLTKAAAVMDVRCPDAPDRRAEMVFP